MNSDVILDTLAAHLFKINSEGNILESHISPSVQCHPSPSANNSNLSEFLPAEVDALYKKWIKKLGQSNDNINFDYSIKQNNQRNFYTAHGSRQEDNYLFIVQASGEPLTCSTPNATEILSAVLNTVPTPIFWKDTQSIYIGCNQQFAKLAGYKNPEQIIGKTDNDMNWKDNDHSHNDNQVISSDMAELNYETTFTNANGSTCALNANKLPLRNKNNQIIGVLGIYEDITDKKHNKNEKAKLDEQARKTQKMEALTRLTGGIAHDFNNILASILGYADLTLDSLTELENQEELVRYISEVINEGEKARDLISQMLAFSRTNSSNNVALNPAPLIKELTKATQTSLPDNIELITNIDEDVEKILIEPSQLHQAVQSLINNSCDALKMKGGHISINISNIEDYKNRCQSCHEEFSGDFVEISVSDDANGIDASILDKIFDPFFSSKEDSGMGLAAVHGIVHDYNGHIIIDSIANYGTNVRLLIPYYQKKTVDHIETTAKSIGYESRILIIENDESIARLQSELLQSKGFKTKVFSDAFQALDHFKSEPQSFDCIVIDQNMPSLSGLEFSDKALALRPDIPIILCINNEQEYSTAAGIKGILRKPFSSEQLTEQICKLL